MAVITDTHTHTHTQIYIQRHINTPTDKSRQLKHIQIKIQKLKYKKFICSQ